MNFASLEGVSSGELFFEMVRVMKCKKPRVAFFENVKNLVNHDNGRTFEVILSELERLGYFVKYAVLNACEYGNVPQNRERIYIVAFKNFDDCNNFVMPIKICLQKTLRDVIYFDEIFGARYYYVKGKCPFYEKLVEAMDDSKAIYQWRRVYVRKNQSGLVPTLTANMGTGGHNVPLIRTDSGFIRKLTPRECFNIQGFPEEFILPKMKDSMLYKQAGNSVVVPVIRRIAEQIAMAIAPSTARREHTVA